MAADGGPALHGYQHSRVYLENMKLRNNFSEQ